MRMLCSFLMLVLVIGLAGCPGQGGDEGVGLRGTGDKGFSVADIVVPGLTEIERIDQARGTTRIKALVGLLDSFGVRVKRPAVFRFELYEYVPRTANNTGRRIHLWDDLNLTDAAKNHDFWRDHYRGYEFGLTLDRALDAQKQYILEVTCITDRSLRITRSVTIRFTK